MWASPTTCYVQQVQCAMTIVFIFCKEIIVFSRVYTKIHVRIYKHSDGNVRKHSSFCSAHKPQIIHRSPFDYL